VMKTAIPELGLGLQNWRNLLRYCHAWKDRIVTDGAAHHGAYRGRNPGSSRISQPKASACASVREKPGSLEREIQVIAGAAQSSAYGRPRPASITRSVANRSGGIRTRGQRAACPIETASRAVPPRAELTLPRVADPAFELIPARHQFGSVQILLMLGWVLNGMSLRGTCRALDWMHEMNVQWGFEFPVPHWTTVRFWLLRLAYHKLHRPKERASDWVWIIDHSNQIGKEKCLLILAVRASQLPPPGEAYPLRLAQLEPIELEPVIVSDKEVVYRQLEANVAKTGVPRAIIDDHGGDLAGGVELFRQAYPETIEIYDISHKAASLLKARLARDQQWKAFAAMAGQTKCKIQQTEWAFLIPPAQRLKARYMNLRPLIVWGFKTLAIVDHPSAEVLQYGTKERLEEKLGWLREFRDALKGWSEMEQVIGVSVDFVRTQGLYRDVERDLRERLAQLPLGPIGADLGNDFSKFVACQASALRQGERLPASSEVIETCFGKFKNLERDQASGGFTGLLLGLAGCVAERTQEVVHQALQKVKTQEVIVWIKTKLCSTVRSKRRVIYQTVDASTTETNESKSETKPEGTHLPSAA
jgi:hypothetical protein